MLHNEQSLQQLILHVMIKLHHFFVNFLIGNLFQDEKMISLLFHIWFSKKLEQMSCETKIETQSKVEQKGKNPKLFLPIVYFVA